MTLRTAIRTARLVIVDDQPANVQLLTRPLTEAGYTGVSSTRNPAEVAALHARHARHDHD